MSCILDLEFCFRGGCGDCIYNSANRTPRTISAEEEARNKEEAKKRLKTKLLRHKCFIENILPKVVVPLLGSADGNGFFFKNHFVTAAHCLEFGPIKFCYQDEIYTFRKEDAVVYETIDKNSDEIQTGDIAIFPFKKLQPYLKIGQDLNILDHIKPGPILAHYLHISEKSSSDSIFATSIEQYKFNIAKFSSFSDSILHKREGSSNTYYSYMFETSTDADIREGSSGSPLINENHEVVGMLIGCRRPETHPNLILFQHLQRFEYQLGLDISDIGNYSEDDIPF